MTFIFFVCIEVRFLMHMLVVSVKRLSKGDIWIFFKKYYYAVVITKRQEYEDDFEFNWSESVSFI